jgi:phosphate transport system protein
MTVVRENYIRKLENLRGDLLNMGNMVEQALTNAVKSLETWDIDLAQQTIRRDKEIDQMQYVIEDRVITLIATQQPVAGDLRLLGTVFAVATELERIGDYAKHIARRLRRATQRAVVVVPPPALREMSALSQKMLSLCLEAFLRQDSEMARSLVPYDTRVDQMEEQLRTELIAQASANPQQIEGVLDILDVVHVLERVADRATNIGERIIYMDTSEVVELNP